MSTGKNLISDIFSQRLKSLREGRGLNQIEVAAAARVAQSAVSSWEKGQGVVPGGHELKLLGDFFGVSVDYLLGRESHPPAFREAKCETDSPSEKWLQKVKVGGHGRQKSGANPRRY